MLNRYHKIAIFAILVFAFAAWIQWWASSGFVLEHQICGETNNPDDCGSYNVFLYSAWRLAKAVDHWSTLITAVATIAIAGFTWTLWLSNEKTTRLTRKIATIARRQMLIARNQTSIQREQHNIARLQFYATHRPRLVVRGVSFADEDGLMAARRLKIRIPIVNQGNTDATVRKIAARAFLVSRLTEINLGGDFHEIDTSSLTPLASGTHAVVYILTDQAFDSNEVFGIVQKSLFLLCVGYVQYRDESGGLRTTGFARCLQGLSSRFTPIEDPEYEFSY